MQPSRSASTTAHDRPLGPRVVVSAAQPQPHGGQTRDHVLRVRPTRPRRPTSRAGRRCDRGQATAELALGLPTLGAIVVLALWLLAAIGSQARVAEAARIGARAAARGDADGQVVAWVRDAAPTGATVEIARRDDQVAVTVHYRLAAAGPLLTPVALTATATAPTEPAISDAATAGVVNPAQLDPPTTTLTTTGTRPPPTPVQSSGAAVDTLPPATGEPSRKPPPGAGQGLSGGLPSAPSRPPAPTPEPSASPPGADGTTDASTSGPTTTLAVR